MTEVMDNIVLVDDLYDSDRRVLRSINSATLEVIDIREQSPVSFLSFVFLVIYIFSVSSFSALINSRKLCKKFSGNVNSSFFSGIIPSLHWLYRALSTAQNLKARKNKNCILHAHDLYCGLAAALAGGSYYIIYDVHELEIHRNRKVGFLRLFFEYGLEKFVLSRSAEVHVVNIPISEFMSEMYYISSPMKISNNNLYRYRSVRFHTSSLPTSIVYVGMGTKGRMLELIPELILKGGFSFHAFLFGGKPHESIDTASWEFGGQDYEPELRKLSELKNCWMWCCLESNSLSYILSTPNKFFQALALGFPVIVSANTYLAEIVSHYKLGIVYDHGELSSLKYTIQSADYNAIVRSQLKFRDKLLNHKLEI